MGKKSGKYESKKPAKMVSRSGKYESKKTDKTADKKETRKKSDIDQEKIEAAEQVLEKYIPMLEELAKASGDILVGVAMRPVHKRLEKIQEAFEAKRNALSGVKEISAKIDRAIANAAKQEETRLENFEKRHVDSIKSEDLEDRVGFRTAVTLGRTMVGSFSARVAKMPYTLAASYQALKGNEVKQRELLVMAKNASREVMGGLSKKNFDYLLETKRIIKTFNKVDDYTTHYEQRGVKVDTTRAATERFVNRNTDGNVRREVSLKLAHIGKKRIFKADDRAELIEDVGNFIARKAALRGKHQFAEAVSEKTVEKSDNLIKKVYNKNRRLYEQLDKRVETYDSVARVNRKVNAEMELRKKSSNRYANTWAKRHNETLGTKVIKLASSANMARARFTAKSDMKITTLYAKAVNVLGFSEHGRNVTEEVGMRAEERLWDAEIANRKLMVNTDRVFGFAERRKANVKNAGEFIENLGKGMASDVSREWKDAKDGFSSWMDDVESRREQQKVRRKFKTADRKIGALSLLQKGAKGVLSMVESSLTNAEEARAAAQLDLDMNPESKKKSKGTSRDDRD